MSESVLYDECQPAALLDVLQEKLPLTYRKLLVSAMREEAGHGVLIKLWEDDDETGQTSVMLESCQCTQQGVVTMGCLFAYAVARALDGHREIELCLPLREYDLQRELKLVIEVLMESTAEVANAFQDILSTGVPFLRLKVPKVRELVTPPKPVSLSDEEAATLAKAILRNGSLKRVSARAPKMPEPVDDVMGTVDTHLALRAGFGYTLAEGHGKMPKGSN